MLFSALCWLTVFLPAFNSPALTNNLALTPPMGFNSFYSYGASVNAALMESIADTMATNGMQAAGYQYLNIDDGWAGYRDTNGVMVPDTNKFPGGIKAVADYLHARGFKVGLYTVAGTNTCAGYPGSFDHIVQDADTYASWGIDYLKYEGCSVSIYEITSRQQIYVARMSQAVANCGRPMVFSSSVSGFENWMPQYINLWRGTGDSGPGWDTVLHHIDFVAQTPSFAGPGAWNDMDVLEIGSGNFSETEMVSIFSMWSILTSPLLAMVPGNNFTAQYLCNPEAIAVDQDPAGIQGDCVSSNNNLQVWSKPLGANNSTNLAVVLFNRGPTNANITANWSDLGLPPGVATVRDLWAHAYAGAFTNSYTALIPAHGAQMLKLVYDTTLPRPAAGTDYLSSLNWLADETNSVDYPDGTLIGLNISGAGLIKMHGVTYTNGLGMNAYTRVSYFLGGAASDFLADIGVDEAADGFGFLVFRVYADGINIFDSGTVSNGTPTLPIDLDVTGKNILTLEASFASTPLQINGYADWANARIIVQPLPPAVPAGLAIAPAANQFTLSWYPSFGAATYNIKRSSAPGGPYATNANVSSTSFTDTNVTADTVYYYAVSAVNAYGESSNSTVVIGSPSYYWNDTVTASPQAWNLNQNWSNTSIFPNYSSTLAILNNYLLSNQTINLNQPITIGFLELGAISNSAAYTIAANGGSLSFYNNDNPVQITQLATSAGDTIAAPITLIGGLTVANNSTNLLTLSGNISTSASFTQAGPGPVLLAASNSFTAPYNVAQGKLIIGNKAALGITGTGVMVARNATLDVNGFNLGAAPVTVSGAGINGSGALISAAAAAQTNALQFVTLAGDTTIGGTTRWDLRGASNFIPSGALSTSGNPFNLVKTGTNQISLASINVDPALADIDVQQGVLSFESAATSMGNPTNTLSVESGATLAFTQTTTSWNKNIVLNGDGFATTISNNSGANTIVGPVTLNGGCLFGVPSGVLVLNGPVSGSGSLTKTLGGQLVIGGTNSWHGNTLVNAGTLAIANPSALAISPLITLASGAVLDAGTLPSGLSLVSHQTLGGSGSVSGNLTIGSGAMLSPANSFGIITFGNNLTLAPGSDTLLEVSPAPLTNDLVRVLGTLTYGGNLILTNLSSSPYAAGDAFQLFAAAASTGGEVRIFPETPGPSLVWDPSSLATTGVLRVIAGSTPQFTTAKLLGGRVSISGTGGVTNGTYYILSSTNCDLPAGQWTRIATNYFDANGNFSFTNSISLSVSATYYLLQLP